MNNTTRRRRRVFGVRVAVAATIVLLTISCPVRGGEVTDRSDSGTFDANVVLEREMPDLLNRYDVPGIAIAIISGGTPAWRRAWGYADSELGRRLSTDTLVRAESITKSITAWGIMRLDEEGLLDLDEPVTERITSWPAAPRGRGSEGEPEGSAGRTTGTRRETRGGRDVDRFQKPAARVTARKLLSHTAGITAGIVYPRFEPNEQLPSRESVLAGTDTIPATELEFEPGERFAYSNPGFVLLEALIEETTGMPFAEYMREKVLSPLGMHASTFAWSERVETGLAVAHVVDGTPVSPYREPVMAHGGLYATVDDLARFVAAGAVPDTADNTDSTTRSTYPTHPILRPESIEKMYEPHAEPTSFHALLADAVGLGHFLEVLPDGRTAVSHGGQGTGTLAWSHRVPESGDGIVVVANSERSFPVLARALSIWGDSIGARPAIARRYAKIRAWAVAAASIAALIAVWRAVLLVFGIVRGDRRFAPTRLRSAVLLCVGAIATAAGVIVGTHKMFAIVLPILSVYLSWSLLALGAVAAAHALFARRRASGTSQVG